MQELLKHFHELSLHPKNAKELKGLILQLAIQGKLTADWRAQNSELISGENSAKNLLKKIKAEKAQLIKNKRIKKEKPLSPVDPVKIKYQLPEEWTWTKLGEVGRIVGGGTPKTNIPDYYSENGIPWLTPADLGKFKGIYIERGRRDISEKGLAKSSAQLMPKGSVLFSSRAPIGHTAISKNPISTNQGFKSCVPYIFDSNKFIYYYLNSIVAQINSEASGTTFKEVSGTDVKNFIFPLAPIQEQQEIVSVIEVLFKEIEALENLTEKRIKLKKDYATSALNELAKNDSKTEWQALKPQFNTFFNEVDNIKKLRETILQLAVQGKLTTKWRAQNPELISGENSANGLLKEIKAEKAKLVKEKKIKMEKALPSITEDEIPYELPEGWVWCRVGDILEMLSDYHANGSYKTLKKHTKLLDDENYAIMLRTTNFHEKNRHNYKYISEETYNFLEKSKLYPGDIIMNKIGDPGTVFWVDDRGKPMSLAMNLFLLRAASHGELNRILYLYLIGNVNYVKSFAAGTSTQTITKDAVKELIFPLAPLNEQDAIVENVNSLMALCEQLEKQIENGQQHIEDLMQSVLKEVLENKQSENKVLV